MPLRAASPLQSRRPKLISLQYRNVNIHDVFTSLSREGKIKIVASKAVQGNVTVFVDSISVMKALALIADTQGLAYYTADGVVHVMTEKEYLDRFGKPFRGRMVTRVLKLHNTSADLLVKSVFLLKSKNGNVIADPSSNSLIVVDYPNIARDIEDVVKQLDVVTEARSFTIRHQSAQSLGDIIQRMLSSSGKVHVDASTNELLVVDTPARIARVAEYIEKADKPSEGILKVIQLRYADPEAVVKHLNDELGAGMGSVVADPSTKKLFIRVMPSTLPTLAALVAELDQKTREVLIEAKIIQISLNDNYKMGVDWNLINRTLKGVEVSSNFRILADTDAGGRINATAVESGPNTLNALIEALHTVGKTDLLSNPRITCVDGEEAKILVGSTIPYKTFDFREDQGVLKTFEKVVTVDVGVKLYVTPIINEDDFITMKIRPEVSEVTSFIDNVPVIDKSETETTVLVKDGVTIIIGGLIKDQKIKTVDKVPVLGSIPILGIPFRKESVQKVKTELVILLRPQIISGDVDMQY